MVVINLKISEAERVHLLRLLFQEQHEGSYYGVMEHYYKRRDNLIKKLEQADNIEGKE